MKTLGIIGGLGPESGCNFFLSINNRFRELHRCQPNLLMENLPVSEEAERDIITGKLGKEHEKLLLSSVRRMNAAGVDFLAIPCNTVHVFLDSLRKSSQKPILSIIEETARAAKQSDVKVAGLLASSKTVREKLHENALRQQGISLITPRQQEQQEIDNIIIRIIHNQAILKDKQFLLQLAQGMQAKGADAIILGCTDLPLLIQQADLSISLINTLQCLEDAVLEKMHEQKPLQEDNNRKIYIPLQYPQ